MQADRQIQGSPVVLEAGGRERRRAEQGFYIVHNLPHKSDMRSRSRPCQAIDLCRSSSRK